MPGTDQTCQHCGEPIRLDANRNWYHLADRVHTFACADRMHLATPIDWTRPPPFAPASGELAGPGSETLDEYRRRLGGDVPSLRDDALGAYDAGDDFERAFTQRYGVL